MSTVISEEDSSTSSTLNHCDKKYGKKARVSQTCCSTTGSKEMPNLSLQIRGIAHVSIFTTHG